MGAMISTMAAGSIKLPAASKITLTNSRNATRPKPWLVIQAAMLCGICSDVIRKENSTALVTMYSNIELMAAAPNKDLGTSLSLRSL